ncbi:MAG: DUF4407 domain-containing protein, partial [Flavobacteriales bacterium]
GFGLIWGLLIFNLDRYIVSTIKKNGRPWSEFFQATPRIILAVIIAVVISKPLEMKIFEKEIDQVLLEQKNELTLANKDQIALQYNPKIAELQQNIVGLKNEVALKETESNALYDTYISEAEGTAGTKLLGKGPVYMEKRDKHDAALAELQQLKEDNAQKVTDLETQISGLEVAYKEQVNGSQPIIDGFDGLMARISALDKLPWFPSFFIFLLFLAIETSPIIVKLLSPRGPYDFKLEDEESAVKTWASQKVAQRELLFNTDSALNKQVYDDLSKEEEMYRYKKQKAEEILKLQADAFHNLQIKNL